jgi:hypothetical protein
MGGESLDRFSRKYPNNAKCWNGLSAILRIRVHLCMPDFTLRSEYTGPLFREDAVWRLSLTRACALTEVGLSGMLVLLMLREHF